MSVPALLKPAKLLSASCVGDAVLCQIDPDGRTLRAKGELFLVLYEGRDLIVRVPPKCCYVLASPELVVNRLQSSIQLAAAEVAPSEISQELVLRRAPQEGVDARNRLEFGGSRT
jgi:hypothetical protein